jgi:hypothetical protein
MSGQLNDPHCNEVLVTHESGKEKMKRLRLLLLTVLVILPSWLAGCGYQNPYFVAKRESAEQKVPLGSRLHVKMWKNRTSELGLQLDFLNALMTKFQDSNLIVLTTSDSQAEYALDGEIITSNEGLTRGTVLLTVGYGLRDLRKGKMVWQVPAQTFSESFYITEDAARTEDNKRKALDKIASDLAETIYIRTLNAFRNRPQDTTTSTPPAGSQKPKDPKPD